MTMMGDYINTRITRKIPPIITASIRKTDINDPVGLTLANDVDDQHSGGSGGFSSKSTTHDCHRRIVVSAIEEDSLAQRSTSLRVGYEIVSINGRCNFHTAGYASNLLRDALGPVQIVAVAGPRPPGTFVASSSAVGRFNDDGNDDHDDGHDAKKIGLRFKSVDGYPSLVRIADVDSDGPFATSSIRPYDICLSIQGVTTTDPDQARDLLATTRGGGGGDVVTVLYHAHRPFRRWAVRAATSPLAWDVHWLSDKRYTLRRKGNAFAMQIQFDDDYTCRSLERPPKTLTGGSSIHYTKDHVPEWYDVQYLSRLQKINEQTQRTLAGLQDMVDGDKENAGDGINGNKGGVLDQFMKLLGCSQC